MVTPSQLDLQTWAQNKVTALYSAETDEQLKQAFESTFTPSVHIKMNSEPMNREDLKSDLVQRRAAAASSAVEWDNAEFKAKDEQTPDDVPHIQAGTFNGSFTVKRSMKYRIRAAPAQLHTIITWNAQIEKDSSVAADPGNAYRIVDLALTYEDTRPPIHFQQPRALQEGNNEAGLD
ncbi:hypothetical protein FIBSPDRAFT_742531 [Athelia psychrophila]|uniref:Uncharacterized protein n=1 Tax=Athelia psychrophila TaxID=1759441 RepID=A0A166IWX1_9AGAM|nr:hypothetical protein FIBSPDRAFT_742531 [Fibularhizoctonia sp. CBS 109695]